MIHIRNKKVKGRDYLYLVKSRRGAANNTSRQVTIKYLRKSANVSIEDIPEDYRNNPKIVEFMALYLSILWKKKVY